MIIYSALFYLFSFIAVISALMVISVKNPVHSVLWLILAFFSSAGLFILLEAEFLAMVLVIVYVGAVAVLFLFVVMMLNVNYEKMKKGFYKLLPLCLLIAVVLFLDLYLVLYESVNDQTLMRVDPKFPIAEVDVATNAHALGLILYTDYVLPFQIAGMILLVAMIGSIVLSLRRRKNVKRQNPMQQFARSRKQSVKLVQVKPGEGINGRVD
jgi:NADH-quinone oxidoreductase subunit J